MKKIVLVFALFLIISFQINAQWHWQNPTPIGKPIYDMQFLDNLNGYVCGYGGMVLKTTNGGLKWEELQVPTDGLIIRIFFIDKDTGWYLTYEDMSLYKTADGGMNWSFVSSFSPNYVTTLWFVNELIGFAGGYNNLLKTTDGGLTWVEDVSVSNCYSFYFVNQMLGFACKHNGIYKTTDGGNTWIVKGIPGFDYSPNKVFAYDQNNIFVIGTDGWINGELYYVFYQSSNGGNSWTGKEFDHQISDIYFESPTSGWVCSGKIFHTTNRGINWDSTNIYAQQFEFKGANSWAAGVNTISYSNDRWQTTTPQIKGVFSGFLWDGCAKDTNTVFACGSNKTIIGSTDGGKVWNNYYSSDDNLYLNGITIKDDEIWAVGQQGMVVYSTDNGINWSEKYIDGNWLSDIAFLSNGVGYIAGSYNGTGSIFTSLNNGDDWSLIESFPNISSIDKIKFSRDKLGWAIGYPETILRSTTGGISWDVVVDTVFGVSNIAVFGDSVWVTHSNKVLRSIDAGNTWESFKVFDYNSIIFSGCDIDFINSKIGYVSAYDSRVFKTIDGGETWEPENYPKGLSNFAMDFVNEEVGWVFGYPGIVLKRDPNFVSVDEPVYQGNDLNTFSLIQNYPNPFNPNTTITYSIPIAGKVSLKIFDVLGNEIATLVNEEKTTGNYTVNFDASNLTSGVYFYRIQAGDYVETKKMIYLK
jgi:photosystem II stability/assembly factor-like uncharacterized protein